MGICDWIYMGYKWWNDHNYRCIPRIGDFSGIQRLGRWKIRAQEWNILVGGVEAWYLHEASFTARLCGFQFGSSEPGWDAAETSQSLVLGTMGLFTITGSLLLCGDVQILLLNPINSRGSSCMRNGGCPWDRRALLNCEQWGNPSRVTPNVSIPILARGLWEYLTLPPREVKIWRPKNPHPPKTRPRKSQVKIIFNTLNANFESGLHRVLVLVRKKE